MIERIDKQRLFDYFAGKATTFEKQQIEAWSREPTHEEQFFTWLDEWEQTHLQYITDQPAALSRYHDFLFADRSATASQPPVIAQSPETPNWLRDLFRRQTGFVWAMAASVIIVMGLFIVREQLLTRTYETAYGETRTLTLPDGSMVTLNANSSLIISRFGFGSQWPGLTWPARAVFGRPGHVRLGRDVRLKGEALFSVTHTATHQPFVVRTDNGPEVVVLGTEFTVFARPRGTKVVLNRGKVVVHYQQPDHQSKQVMMKPGDLVTLNPNGDMQHQQTRQPPTNPPWTDHRFVFEKTPLTEIVAMLRENYGLTIDIADAETGQLTLSGAYPARNTDELLQIIAEVLNIDITRQANKFILTQKTVQ